MPLEIPQHRLFPRIVLNAPLLLIFGALQLCAVVSACAQSTSSGAVIASGLTRVNQIISHPTSPAITLVTQGSGTVRKIEGGRLRRGAFIDIEDLVSEKNADALFGIAFSPHFPVTRFVYVGYVDRQGDTVIARLTAATDDEATAESMVVLLKVVQPSQHVRTGAIGFGPDGMLYIGVGDGGYVVSPEDYAQNKQSLLGKVLRIDPGRDEYLVPRDNPFSNDKSYLPEIFALGVRDPFLILNHSPLFVADRGTHYVDELNEVTAGSNLGWGEFEGDRCRISQCSLNDKTSTAPKIKLVREKGECLGAAYIQKSADKADLLLADCRTGRITSTPLPLSENAPNSQIIATINKPVSAIGASADGTLLAGTATGEVIVIRTPSSTTLQ